jgi:hypothetical protein
MLSRPRTTPLQPARPAQARAHEAPVADEDAGLFGAIERLPERLPSWPFHAAAVVMAMTAAWFAMVLLGGVPRGVVEWIVTALFAAFAYALGFSLSLLFACLVATVRRISALVVLAGGLAAIGLLAAQGPV